MRCLVAHVSWVGSVLLYRSWTKHSIFAAGYDLQITCFKVDRDWSDVCNSVLKTFLLVGQSAVPFWGQISQILRNVFPERD